MIKKVLKSILILVFVIILSGCDNQNEDNNSEIIKSKVLRAIDIAPEFIIKGKTLKTYHSKYDPNVSYVNITEFINFMEGGIVDLNISKEDQMIITYTSDVPIEYQDIYGETYTYEMIIDAKTDVLSFSDFELISNLNVETLTQYETDLVVSDIEIIDDDPSLEIDLSLYGMDILLVNNEYYMPLYLANLFFTGPFINVYEINERIYIFDNFTDLTKLGSQFEENKDLKASEIAIHTKNYLTLYFDYFYGLKEFNDIDTYRTILDQYDFDEIKDFDDLDKEIENFINSQNDLHTQIVSAGYMNPYYMPMLNHDKFNSYINAYNQEKCSYRKSEIYSYNFDDIFVIQVNGFSLDTRTLLKPVMEQASHYDDIIIDVRCNPGGNLVGAIELLSYMTDEEIQVSYINPTTGGKVTEFYEMNDNVHIDKNFYVYTSAATFSAANLFTSIVKDQGLGIIFGGDSSGGASAINYTVLPDGSLITNSSTLTFINNNGEVIEDGIEGDIDVPGYVTNMDNLVYYLTHIFNSLIVVTKDKHMTLESYVYDFNINNNSGIINIKDYELSVYEQGTNKLVYEETFTSNDFSFSIDKIEGNKVLVVEITARYNVNHASKEEIIYKDFIDDHPKYPDVNVNEIPIGEAYTAYMYSAQDYDAFKFTISEEGLYRIELNDKQLHQHRVYDENGQLIGEGYDFQLTPGMYYLITNNRRIGQYSITINQLYDDTTEPTVINLEEGTKQYELHYDYLLDDESFEIHVEEESMVTFSWTANPNYQYRIKKSNGELFIPNSNTYISVDKDLTVILPKGTYIIELSNYYEVGEIQLTVTATTNFVDVSGDLSLESDKYGELKIGLNTMEFLTLWDQDIYYIDILEAGNYVFHYDKGKVLHISSYCLSYMDSDYPFSLSPGRHYFLFSSYENYQTIDFELIHDVDLNNENNMVTIQLDQEISTIISDSNDTD